MNVTAKEIRDRRLTEEQVGIWYLGQEGILFGHQGEFLGVDLYLSDYVDRNCCSEQVRWVRRYAPPVEPETLNFLHVVLCTHAHEDHADPVTLTAIANANPETVFVVPAPETAFISAYGIEKTRLVAARADQTLQFGAFSVTPVPAAHEQLHPDEHGDYRELSYLIKVGGQRFFHGGDMCLYDGLAEQLKQVDVAFLPVNGRDYFRTKNGIIGNIDCAEAVTFAKEIGAGMLVPMHHDLYAVNGLDPVVFVQIVQQIDPGRAWHLFTPGEGYISMKA